MKKTVFFSLFLICLLAPPAWPEDLPLVTLPDKALSPLAQHINRHPGHPEPAPPDFTHPPEHTMEPIQLDQDSLTPRQLILLNMRRDGSGTGWQPIDNPMQMLMGQAGPWTTMLHWSAFVDYDNQGGPRGDQGIYSQNWIMASAARPVGQRGVFQARTMMSLDPLTVGKKGYPSLFQTGETYQGEPLIDRQHPHDLFMELAAQYYHRLWDNTWFRLYAAPVGEPALGPVAFPHRYSALLNPESVLSHHMQDSTHIAFGVLTAGLIHRNWQVEGSIFNGKEPDENRYDFDFDGNIAYSGRISYIPGPNWVFQTSYGYLNDPEALEPGDVQRITSSIQHIKTWLNGWWATTLAFGRNFTQTGPDENGVLLESLVNLKQRNYLYGRIENVVKHGLLTHDDGGDHHHDQTFTITAFTLGVARDLLRIKGIPVTLGAQLTAYAKPDSLNAAYGDFPLSFHIYLHTNAPRMTMAIHPSSAHTAPSDK